MKSKWNLVGISLGAVTPLAALLGCAGIRPGEGSNADAGVQGDVGSAGDSKAGEDSGGADADARPPRTTSDGAAFDVVATAPDAACIREIKAVVRDFRGWAAVSGNRHPDFEGVFTGHKGIVAATLGLDSKPVYAAAGATPATTGPAEFDQWYRDVPGVNMRFDDIVLPLAEDPARRGVYFYDNQAFFPINGRGWTEAFGTSNFHFTTEIHLEFPYRGGELFTFRGDDDLFLFINGRLAIDLGGVHPADTLSVNLDEQAAALGIERNKTYRMDIFHAERHTTFSTFRIETTIQCITSIIVP